LLTRRQSGRYNAIKLVFQASRPDLAQNDRCSFAAIKCNG
jgi:hypothetical protein